MKETLNICRCGSNLYEYNSTSRNKKGKRTDLMCWNCGLWYKASGKLDKINAEGVVMHVGHHNKKVG